MSVRVFSFYPVELRDGPGKPIFLSRYYCLRSFIYLNHRRTPHTLSGGPQVELKVLTLSSLVLSEVKSILRLPGSPTLGQLTHLNCDVNELATLAGVGVGVQPEDECWLGPNLIKHNKRHEISEGAKDSGRSLTGMGQRSTIFFYHSNIISMYGTGSKGQRDHKSNSDHTLAKQRGGSLRLPPTVGAH